VKKEQLGDLSFLYAVFPGITKKQFINKINDIDSNSTICLFINEGKEKHLVAIKVSSELQHSASELLQKLLKSVSGKGGGNKDLAQGNILPEPAQQIVAKFKKCL